MEGSGRKEQEGRERDRERGKKGGCDLTHQAFDKCDKFEKPEIKVENFIHHGAPFQIDSSPVFIIHDLKIYIHLSFDKGWR